MGWLCRGVPRGGDKGRPPLAAFTTSPSILSHPSFSRPALRRRRASSTPPHASGCLAAPFARNLLFHGSTGAPRLLSSPPHSRRPLIAESWDLLDPTSLAMRHRLRA